MRLTLVAALFSSNRNTSCSCHRGIPRRCCCTVSKTCTTVNINMCEDIVWALFSRVLWVAHKAMLVLEHATFASSENEAAVVGLAMPAAHAVPECNGSIDHASGSTGRAPDVAGTPGGSEPFGQWLVCHLADAVSGAASVQPASSSAAEPQVPTNCRQLILKTVNSDTSLNVDAAHEVVHRCGQVC